MKAQCPLCTTLFETDRHGVQFCPTCGGQVNVAEPGRPAAPDPSPAMAPSSAPPRPAVGAGPVFLPPPGPYGDPLPAGAVGPAPTRGPTPWERRGELGWRVGFAQTLKGVLFAPDAFFPGVEPKGRGWDALLFAWLCHGISAALAFPFLSRQAELGAKQLAELEGLFPGLAARVERLAAFLESPPAQVGGVVLYPAIFLLGAVVLHACCLLFGAGKNGFGATVRAWGYSQGPALFGFLPFVGFLAALWSFTIIFFGLWRTQDSTFGRTAGALLLPPLLLPCCCGAWAAVALAGFAKMP